MLSFVLLASIVSISFGSNCSYPSQFPSSENYTEVEILVFVAGVGAAFEGYETPLQARNVLGIGTNQWNCMANYDDTILSLRSDGRPILSSFIPS